MKLNLLSKITAPVVRGASKLKFKAVKYSPEICLVVGVVTGVATVITACKATLKSGDILDTLAEEKAEIAKKEIEAKETGKEFNKGYELTVAYTHAGVGFIKLYRRPAALGAVSLASFLGAYGIIKGRNMRLIGACTAFEKGFREYRERVVEKYGVEADRELATGVKAKEVLTKKEDAVTGEVVTEKKEVPTMEKIMMGDFSNFDRVFARGLAKACQSYDPHINTSFLRGQETYFTCLLRSRGYVFLSEVYDKLGFPVTAESRLVGWIIDYADPNWRRNEVSFGLMPEVFERDGDFVFPTGKMEASYIESGYYLTFNIDGLIWNLI